MKILKVALGMVILGLAWVGLVSLLPSPWELPPLKSLFQTIQKKVNEEVLPLPKEEKAPLLKTAERGKEEKAKPLDWRPLPPQKIWGKKPAIEDVREAIKKHLTDLPLDQITERDKEELESLLSENKEKDDNDVLVKKERLPLR